MTDFLTRQLDTIGESLLTKEYGSWRGRTCTDQSVMLDGALQTIAHRLLRA